MGGDDPEILKRWMICVQGGLATSEKEICVVLPEKEID